METYYIIYPRGDRSKISIVGLTPYLEYELSDYAVASRQSFTDDKPSAIEYAKKLAKENNLKYCGDDEGYLD
jgi:hypothetical protein